jgi:hypothetical protein
VGDPGRLLGRHPDVAPGEYSRTNHPGFAPVIFSPGTYSCSGSVSGAMYPEKLGHDPDVSWPSWSLIMTLSALMFTDITWDDRKIRRSIFCIVAKMGVAWGLDGLEEDPRRAPDLAS